MRDSYSYTRIVFLRYIGAIYFVAFLCAYTQNTGLIGDDGLTPARPYLEQVLHRSCGGDRWRCMQSSPTLLWYMVDFGSTGGGGEDHGGLGMSGDAALDAVAVAGLALSGLVVVLGAANVPVMAALWALYTSLVNVGQTWYGFGWESQLLETGFLAIWLCPWLFLFPRIRKENGEEEAEAAPPSRFVVAWAYRWLLFRIMLGAGLIKIRGDQCWRDLTCMDYHYETQPVPNPLSPAFHASPWWWHRAETLGNHVVELLLPWLLLLGRDARLWGGIFQAAFQGVLICSGNLSFLNWLTIAPAIWCFDDASLQWCFRRSLAPHRKQEQEQEQEQQDAGSAGSADSATLRRRNGNGSGAAPPGKKAIAATSPVA